MLQEFNQKQKTKVALTSPEREMSELAWWRTWTSSWWANVYF
ncbi:MULTISPECIES: Trp operon leader peptide [Vibrio]|uniref:Trp operon leader peptide n=2 Tax=Vibrio TaxID=662 RepID=A0A090P3V1_9VIBR|nr:MULTISPECIES: Trp operon leader peptide [Vibrio]KAB1454156.1 Trp operon leader peptide [Vibrio panuliri]OLQ87740.1 Trp operon leader peptide [Vibrio ponticus]OLQ90309.1 Trp operon leader peptide [Vibrio panuliri]OLQ93629.1 Trp operon leader peptide [Vibrio panuliri]ROV58588.1 Trp operon leader peptide [Vibrio ponticus]